MEKTSENDKYVGKKTHAIILFNSLGYAMRATSNLGSSWLIHTLKTSTFLYLIIGNTVLRAIIV